LLGDGMIVEMVWMNIVIEKRILTLISDGNGRK